jgi:hypothetical protein
MVDSAEEEARVVIGGKVLTEAADKLRESFLGGMFGVGSSEGSSS